jgi:hypothetical protein
LVATARNDVDDFFFAGLVAERRSLTDELSRVAAADGTPLAEGPAEEDRCVAFAPISPFSLSDKRLHHLR